MTQGKDFKGRQFTAEVILWAVRWYLMFPISVIAQAKEPGVRQCEGRCVRAVVRPG